MANVPKSAALEANLPIEAAQIIDHALAAASTEVDRLKAETETAHREAIRNRDRTRNLAVRYARRVRQKWSDVRAELETQQQSLDEARGQFTAEIVRFKQLRAEIQAAATDEAKRLRAAWADLETHRGRIAAERAEANELIAKQEAAWSGRAADLAKREQAVAGIKSRIEMETAALRQEAAGLEVRAHHARGIVDDLEKKRDELRAELLASAPRPEAKPPGEMSVPLDRRADRDLAQWTADLDAQDRQQAQEKANLARVKASLDREATSLADQRKVLAEQFSLLAAARSDWQDVEGRTVAEMEELARALRVQQEELAAREERLVKAEVHRRDETARVFHQAETADEELPWASEEVEPEPVVLPFAFHSRAA